MKMTVALCSSMASTTWVLPKDRDPAGFQEGKSRSASTSLTPRHAPRGCVVPGATLAAFDRLATQDQSEGCGTLMDVGQSPAACI